MTSNDIEALISYRMERSRESIQAAEIMLEKGMLTFAMNRIYYSMFYAVQAILGFHGDFIPKSRSISGLKRKPLRKRTKMISHGRTLTHTDKKSTDYTD